MYFKKNDRVMVRAGEDRSLFGLCGTVENNPQPNSPYWTWVNLDNRGPIMLREEEIKTFNSLVYHAKNYPQMLKDCVLNKERERIFPDDFVLVAEVKSKELGDVFRLTNHIDHSWHENEEVKVLVESRSTSINDVVVLSTGMVYVCKAIGWEEIGHINNVPIKFLPKIL